MGGFDDLETGGGADFLTGRENSEVVAAVSVALERFREPGLELWMAGGPYLSAHQVDLQRTDMALFSGLSLLAIAALLFVLFRRAAAVLLPLVTIGLSIVSSFGAMALLGIPLGLPTQILPSFLLAVGVGASVHLLVIFFRAFDDSASREEALVHAFEHSGLAIVMTAATTAGGLASFAASEIAPVQRLGLVAPLGVGLGLVYVLGLLPALLARPQDPNPLPACPTCAFALARHRCRLVSSVNR